RRRHTRFSRDWSSDVCSSDLSPFNEEHDLFRASVKDFLKREVIPNLDQWEKDGEVPREVYEKFGAMGYFGLRFPEAYGGSDLDRSEERRVGKECRYVLSQYHN